MWRLFLIEAADDGVYNRVKCCGGRMFSFEAMLIRALREVGFDGGVYDGFKGFCFALQFACSTGGFIHSPGYFYLFIEVCLI